MEPEIITHELPDTRPSAHPETLEQKNARAAACGADIEAVLKRHNCSIDVGLKIFAGRVDPIVNIVPRD